MAISNFALEKDKITGSWCFWIAVKNPTLSAVRDLFCKWCKDVVTQTGRPKQQQTLVNKRNSYLVETIFFAIKLIGNDITSKWIVDIPKIRVTPGQIPRPSFPVRDTGSDLCWCCSGLGMRLIHSGICPLWQPAMGKYKAQGVQEQLNLLQGLGSIFRPLR